MSAESLPALPAPPLSLLLKEGRVPLERLRFHLKVDGLLEALPRGDGHPVLVIPGFGASDRTVSPLVRALRRLGYDAQSWGLGRNLGLRGSLRERLRARLDALHAGGGAVSLVGWSLGGVFARELARAQPEKVRRVFTLGSPFNGRPEANNLHTIFQWVNRGSRRPADLEGFLRRRVTPPVPCTAIHTREDGIVAWRCSLEPEGRWGENLEVRGSHLGLICNLEVLQLIAERLAQPSSAAATASGSA
ncbi:MAG TPA: alpha/beta fold hydrolase [Nevskiaceae bacterium]|nr:alpha/beta fold hydrolase [Nevskiaceae bacterium]